MRKIVVEVPNSEDKSELLQAAEGEVSAFDNWYRLVEKQQALSRYERSLVKTYVVALISGRFLSTLEVAETEESEVSRSEP